MVWIAAGAEMKQLLLLRHGRTVANEQRKYCGWTDSPLSDAGRADLATQKVQYRYPSLSGFAVYTSGFCRTEQTLQALYGDVAHTVEPGFREINFGIFENRTYEEMKDEPEYQAWLSGDNEENVCPGGESSVQMKARVLAALERVLARDERVCIICHGGVIAAIMAHLFPDEPKNRYTWQPKNACGYLIQLEPALRYVPVPFAKANWEGKHYSFFQNRACEFFPCHEGIAAEEFNCLFCYCPLYALGDQCGGKFTYTENGIKNCTDCPLPHCKSSYGYIMRRFDDLVQMMRENHLTPSIGDGKAHCPLEK